MPEQDRPALPDLLPIFPLTGVLLLPRGRLPLNIFEPRYLAMTRDALGGERLIGMIQPTNVQPGNVQPGNVQPGDIQPSDPAGSAGRDPPVYPVGCAGRITAFSETDDGRLLITLTGVSRFRIRDELPLLSGYRRVVPDWDAFAADRAGDDRPDADAVGAGGFDRERLLRGLRLYFTHYGIGGDWAAIEAAPDRHLVTSIAMLCPFEPGEKQALLEAPNLAERARLVIAIVEMAVMAPAQAGPSARH